MEFKFHSLSELVKIKYGKNQKQVQDNENGKYPILGTGGLIGYSKEYLYDKPSVLIGRKGTIDKVKFIDEPFWTVDTLFYTEVNENLVIPKYLYYLMSLTDFSRYNEGTSIPSLRTETLNRLEFSIPNLGYQKRVLAILSKIDEKIQLNKKLNQNLESFLKFHFYDYFVDFLNKYDKFKDSELGKIPYDWNVIPLGDLVKSIDNRGKTPPLVEDLFDFPIIDVRALSGENRIVDYSKCTKFVDEETYINWFRSGHPKELDILISTVGTIASLKLFLGSKGCLAQNVVGLRSDKKYSLYLYQYFKYIKKDLEAYDIGSVQPSIKLTHIFKHPILIPNDDILNEFNNLSKNITKLIFENSLEIQKLSKLRDTLLPKLMSGEIDVSNVEI